MRHRPEPTDHGMHCRCGVFCGHGIASWRAHRDDFLILHPDADTRSDLTVAQEAIRVVGQAYANAFNLMSKRFSAALKSARARQRDDFTRG